MELVQQYGGGVGDGVDDVDVSDPVSSFPFSPDAMDRLKGMIKNKVHAAPPVNTKSSVGKAGEYFEAPTALQVFHNPEFSSLWSPVQGPSHPILAKSVGAASSMAIHNHTGYVEPHYVTDSTFLDQFHSFHQKGTAINPDDPSRTIVNQTLIKRQQAYQAAVAAAASASASAASVASSETESTESAEAGTTTTKEAAASEVGTATTTTIATSSSASAVAAAVAAAEKRKRKGFGDASDTSSGGFLGPWAPYEEEDRLNKELAAAAELQTQLMEQTVETAKEAKKRAKKEGVPLQVGAEEDLVEGEDERKIEEDSEGKKPVVHTKSIFHGSQFRDYLGRTYVDPPTWLKNTDHQCFLPKKLIHTWDGHTKGVNVIKFFPKYGHLILSASMDSTCKIWDVYNNQKCLRTFMGHSKGVRDICFTHDGRKFVSCSYDRIINLWDTETGACLGSFSNRKIPICVTFNPDPGKQHVFLAGMNNNKIVQFDINSGKVVQVYNEHLGPVNTITFVDDNRRFISSSDDKSLRVWDFNIPVVIKHINEPTMHSMPAATVHPSGSHLALQSMDNRVLLYGAKDHTKFRLDKKKMFKGHINAGYACRLAFSPDGHFLCTGDGDGKAWFWDWHTTRVLKTLNCHESVCIDIKWHPIEPSRIATCGWDGKIHYWD